MKDIQLSIIVPVYNTEDYLKRCIDSIIASLKNLENISEIIVVNDGSLGNTDEIMSEYENYPFIKYIKQENKGRGGARNTGLKNAKGKYIGFVDSDDYIAKEMYHSLYSKIALEDADIIICDFETIDTKKNNNYRFAAKNENILDDKWGCFDISMMPSSCNKLFKKSLYEGIIYPEHVKYEDLAINPILMLKANKIIYIPEMYYKYYLSDSSAMRVNFSEENFKIINILEYLYNEIEKLNISKEDKQRAMYMVYTKRLYEDVIEPIIYEKYSVRYRLLSILCGKISNIQKIMLKNPYFSKEIYEEQSKVKRIGNKFLNWCLNNKHIFLLSIVVSKHIYYRFINIKYTSVII